MAVRAPIGGSWEARFRFSACIGTMNPPPTPPEEGSQCRARLPSSPPGRGQGWVGSWAEGQGEGSSDTGLDTVIAPSCASADLTVDLTRVRYKPRLPRSRLRGARSQTSTNAGLLQRKD